MSVFKICVTKSTVFIDSKMAKKFKAASIPLLHYDIPEDAPITKSHLLALILYCDTNDPCTAFSSTFRISNPFIPLKNLWHAQKQNGEFANWSRLLRETVEIYGSCGVDATENKFDDGSYKVLSGPFYCGMSRPMVLKEFNIRLCAPTSTSKVVEVADRFGGDQGIVIEMNNNGYANAHKLRMFNCMWISCHPEEHEVLFIGGFERIRVQTIRMLEGNRNYSQFIEALFYFHCILNGTIMDKISIPNNINKHCKTLENLIEHRLNMDGFRNKYPRYINACFRAFALHQTQIVINLEMIHTHFGMLSGLIINIYSDNITGKNNLFRDDLYALFPNIKSIIIYSSHHEIDLVSLLSLMNLSSKKYNKSDVRITLKAKWYKNTRSWLYKQLMTKGLEICSKEMEYQLIIHRLSPVDFDGNRKDSIIIEHVPL
eukprot:166479_1